MKDYYRILIDGIDTSAVVSRIVCGKSWTGAELSDGSFGIAMHTAGRRKGNIHSSEGIAMLQELHLVGFI